MKQLLDAYKTLRTQKQYLKIILANIINRFGDSIDAIAFTWLVYEVTQSATWSTVIFGMNMLPTILLQPFTGALVENMRKKNIMIICDIARGVSVSIIAISYLSGNLTPWMILAVTLLDSTFETFRIPAGISIVPKLLDEEHYEIGTALNSTFSRAMELIGTGCAGFIIGIFGISTAIFIDAITFIGSAIVIGFIRYNETITKEKLSLKSYTTTLKEGLHYMKCRQAVLVLCLIGALLNAVVIPINSLLPVFIDSIMKSGSEMLSMLSVGMTIGSIIGSFLYPLLTDHITKRRLLLATIVFVGFFYILIVYIPNVIPQKFISDALIVGMFTILGLLSAAVSTFVAVFLMQRVDPNYMARVGAVFNAFVTLTIPIGSLVISVLLQITSFVTIFLGFGILSIFLYLILRKRKIFFILDENPSKQE